MFDQAMREMPLVAILRGIRPAEGQRIAAGMVEAGITAIEVPLNSPEPLETITLLSRSFGSVAAIGAGTVVEIHDVERVADAGASFVVSPHTDPPLIRECVARQLEVLPGFVTASEAFAAVSAGATRLKLFPAASFGPDYLRALAAVLPESAAVFPVGGIGPGGMADWLRAGAVGFGLGSSLYKAGDDPALVQDRARTFVSAYQAARRTLGQ